MTARGPYLKTDDERTLLLVWRALPGLVRAWQRHGEDSGDDEVMLILGTDGTSTLEVVAMADDTWRTVVFSSLAELLAAIGAFTEKPAKLAMARRRAGQVLLYSDIANEDTDEAEESAEIRPRAAK